MGQTLVLVVKTAVRISISHIRVAGYKSWLWLLTSAVGADPGKQQ